MLRPAAVATAVVEGDATPPITTAVEASSARMRCLTTPLPTNPRKPIAGLSPERTGWAGRPREPGEIRVEQRTELPAGRRSGRPTVSTPFVSCDDERSSAPEAWRGPVGPGLPRAAQHGRADQEGRRRAARPRADRADLRARWLPLDREAGPPFADAVVGPLHAAETGCAGRAHGGGRARGARGRALHDADPDRRRPDDDGTAAGDRVGLRDVRPRPRRRDRPPEHPAALDPDRGRPRDLRTDRGDRADDRRSVRRHAPRDPGMPTRRRRGGRGDRRLAGDRADPRAVHRLP